MKTKQINKKIVTRMTVLLFALFLVVLAGCGGDETPAAEVAVEESALEESAAEEPAVEEPAVEGPTAEPPAEEQAAPTVAEPVEEQAPEPAEEVALSGDCGNAYYPVVEGRIYTYRSTLEGTGESEFATSFSDVSDSSFTVSTDVGMDEVFSTTWQCSGDGLLSPEFGQMPGEMEGMTIEFVEADGVTIPSEDKFQIGETWMTHYVANANIEDTGAGEMSMTQTFDMTNTVSAIESVSVPAGDYPEAVRVDTTGTVSLSYMVAGNEQPAMSIEMSYSSWYVEGVGMVKQDFSGLFGSGEQGGGLTELVSIQ